MTPRLLFAVSERRAIVLLPEPRECACGRYEPSGVPESVTVEGR